MRAPERHDSRQMGGGHDQGGDGGGLGGGGDNSRWSTAGGGGWAKVIGEAYWDHRASSKVRFGELLMALSISILCPCLLMHFGWKF